MIEFYVSPNGDRWSLHFHAADLPVVRHVPNLASGGQPTEASVADFLSSAHATPQGEALVELMAQCAGRADCGHSSGERTAVGQPVVEGLLLVAVRVRTFANDRHLTNASGFFFRRDERLFLVTSRHVLSDPSSQHLPDRLEIELHIDIANLGASTWFSLPLYMDGVGLWREGVDGGGDVDVAVLEVHQEQLPQTAVIEAFGPEHLPKPQDVMPVGASVLICISRDSI